MSIDRFLKENKLDKCSFCSHQLIQSIISEMEYGLSGKKSTLPMLLSYIDTGVRGVQRPRRVIAIDAGGTRLRLAKVEFDKTKTPKISMLSTHRMPGSRELVSCTDFHQSLISYLEPILAKSSHIGYCFSYPLEMLPTGDGKLLYWTKEIKIPDMVGKRVGLVLQQQIKKNGFGEKKVLVLNDAVSVLLAGQAKRPAAAGHIGVILGTGFNVSYVERNSSIAKTGNYSGQQAINVEPGNFGKCPKGKLDVLFDRSTDNPSQGAFEKMISGVYLGPLCLMVLNHAAAAGILSHQGNIQLKSISHLDSPDLTHFLLNGSLRGLRFGKIDHENILQIIESVINRAAYLVAVTLAAIIKKTDPRTDVDHPMCITVEGSTFYQIPGFSKTVYTQLSQLLKPLDTHFRMERVENAPIIGAAYACNQLF